MLRRKIFPIIWVTILLLTVLCCPAFFASSVLAEITPDKEITLSDDFLLAMSQGAPQDSKSSPKETAGDNIPAWIKRTSVTIEGGSDIKPKYSLETIQPLFGTQEKEVVFFNQSRISARSDRSIYNIGFGLRKIVKDAVLLGVNAFYDYQDLNKHSRVGVGFEGIGDRGLEARANTYIRVSNERLVKDDGINLYYEKVANGFDWELGSPLPYLPFLKVYGGGYWYNFEHFKNKYGWQMRLEYKPMQYSRLAFIILDDTKRNEVAYRFEGALTLAFTSFSPRDIINDIKGSKEAFPKIDLNERILDRVVRDFDITVITSIKSKSTGFTVEGGKKG